MSDANVTTDRRPWILAALMLSMMLAAMDTTIVSTAIPQVVGDLGGFALFTWVFSIYLLTQTVTIPIYGKLADIYGRKPILIVGSLIFLAGSAASAAAPDMLALIVFRGIQGLGAGSIMAIVNTLAGDLYNLRERARIQGFLSSVWGISAIVGPTLGGAFAEYVSWRWIFLINLPIGVGAIALLSLYLHESVERERHDIDYAGSMAVLVAVGTLIFGLLQGGTAWPWLSWPSLVVFAASAILLAIAVWTQRRAAEPIMPGWLWRHRALAGVNLSMVGMGFVVMGPNAYLPTYAQSVFGLGAVTAGLVLASMSISWPTASALAGRAYLRIGFRDTALIGSVLITLAGGAFLALPYGVPVWAVVIDQVALGAGFGLLSTSTLVGAQTLVNWRERGVVTGANMFSRFLGQSFGVAVFGAIFNATLTARLDAAPADLAAHLPDNVDAVMTALHGTHIGGAAASYLRHAIFAATHHLYIGLVIVAVATLLAVLCIPRGFGATTAARSG
ncbi:MDR family MFS transporter [Salinisphaera sp.]|uniref:MDR family MFS transporter n=1 Tax=Salinisphaera sp. TaxID=1914330 RepID=UPI002D796835|nr:MDR family MFS transporter [Salinisphaera sp.]HET7313903.1 MDR family MFS transporter [Salinisphaera sp.]